mmetsp:Transcript_18989/g.26714  ORF Transcript_18989/g.26714 Transcript_18989/m.26714 type:complete len:147 (+) Transcript_18989:588-1028(+)
MAQRELERRGENSKARQIGSMIDSVKKAPADTAGSIPRPPRMRKTLRRMEAVRRKIAKTQRRRAKQGSIKGDGDVERRTGLELSKPPSKSTTDGLPGRRMRKKTPRRPLGRKLSFKARRALKGGNTSRGKNFYRKLVKRRGRVQTK